MACADSMQRFPCGDTKRVTGTYSGFLITREINVASRTSSAGPFDQQRSACMPDIIRRYEKA